MGIIVTAFSAGCEQEDQSNHHWQQVENWFMYHHTLHILTTPEHMHVDLVHPNSATNISQFCRFLCISA